MTRLSIPFACALSLCALPVLAQDGKLYEDPADPNASFVRIVAPGETLAVIGTDTFDNMQAGVTPYVTMAPGEVSASVAGLTGEGDIPPSSFYSFVTGTDGTLVLLQDVITNNPAMADLVFYNLSDVASVDLFVPSVEAMALDGVEQNTSRQVALKAPLTLGFEVRDGATVLAELPDIEMRRRAGVTVVFTGTAGDYSAFSTEIQYLN